MKSKKSITDTTYKAGLHKLISKNIKARRLEVALQNCQKMKALYPEEEGAYFAGAFIYNLQHKYSLAAAEIEKEISIGGKPDLELIIAIIKRKANREGIKI